MTITGELETGLLRFTLIEATKDECRRLIREDGLNARILVSHSYEEVGIPHSLFRDPDIASNMAFYRKVYKPYGDDRLVGRIFSLGITAVLVDYSCYEIVHL